MANRERPIVVATRLNKAELEAVQKVAKRNERSVAAEIRLALKERVEREEKAAA